MSEKRRTRSNAAVSSLTSSHIDLEPFPSEHVKAIPRCPEESVEKETGNAPGEEESDSGDSLFLTQKPVPKALRSGRQPRTSQRSTPISPRFLEVSGSSSDSEAEDGLERNKKRTFDLPKYIFPFLKQRKSKSRGDRLLASQHNKALHYYAMGGFFNCVKEMWPNCESSDYVEPSLPTVDSETEEITPISEDEKSEEEDIKIIDNKQFVFSLKPESSQPWYNPQKKGKGETSRQDSIDSDATFIGDYEPSSSSRYIAGAAQKDAAETLTELQPGTISVNDLSPLEELDDIPESQSLLQNTPSSKSASNNDGKKSKKKKKRKKVMLEDVANQNQEESVNVEENEGSLVLFEDNSTKSPNTSQQEPDELLSDTNVPREEDGDHFKDKEDKSIGNGKVHDMESDLENTLRRESVSLLNCNAENEENGQRLCENTEQLSSELVVVDSMTQKKKKKKKHKREISNQENAEMETTGINVELLQISNNVQVCNSHSIAASEEMSDLTDGKRKKLKKKRKASSDNCNNEEVVSLKKAKKTLKPFDSDKNSLSKSAESYEEQAELVNSAVISATGNTATQSDESVSVRKKKKKRRASFFVAETVENPLHLEQNPLSPSGDVQGCGADTLGISTNDNETESAETGGRLHEPVVKKKKKKHKRDQVDEDHKKEFEEPDNLDSDALPKVMSSTETTETLRKAKKKSRRNESEECDGAEVSHPQSDESGQPKKKKKKKSKHKSPHTHVDSEITTVMQVSERVKERSPITSPDASENQETDKKRKKKKKRKHYDDATEGKAVETTEQEQDTVKRKKHKKNKMKDNEHVEMSPSSDSPMKNCKTKVKKKLYNPNNTPMKDSSFL